MEAHEIAGLVREAAERLRGKIRETPIDRSHALEAVTEGSVHLKLENIQHTGSFKFRGALNRVLSLTAAERKAGVVAASTGNHGAGVALACQMESVPCRVFAPSGASAHKLATIESYGAQVVVEGDDGVVSERAARGFAEDQEITYISPYNDPLVVAGQGTIGEELSRQLDHVDAIFVSLGGGGLIAGIAGFLRTVHPDVEVVACSARNSKVMYESLRAGKILDLDSEPTLSDGTAGGVEAGSVTFKPCRELIDRHVLLSEDEIAEALRWTLESQHLLVEGSAAMAVAGLAQSAERYKDATVAVVLCGGNISLDTLRDVLGGSAD